MHEAFSIPNIVDTAVLRKQAWMRLTDTRNEAEDTIIHSHKAPYGPDETPYKWNRVGVCNERCVIFHRCPTDNKPRTHSVAEMCPTSAKD